MSSDSPIGVFDSGVGGLSVLSALQAELPGERFVYFSDAAHAPYGERGDAFVIERTLGIARQLVEEHHIKALVVACNTATAAGIGLLRSAYPGLPIVGVEPALKPAAAATRTGHVGVLATRGTLASGKFKALHDSLKTDSVRFSLMPCDGLAGAIERLDEAAIQSLAARYVGDIGRFGHQLQEIDTLVLGCTHYPFIAADLQRLAGAQVRLIETGQPVAQQTRRLLAAKGQLAGNGSAGSLQLLTSGNASALDAAAARWLPSAEAAALR
ncbi:MAG: glutamate racemase [Proteobacteria bacterium]|nr:glutamate racemase [Pseudomonadota bacterium]